MKGIMLEEIRQQPAALERFVKTQKKTARELGKKIRERKPAVILLIARGSSDNAAIYGKYLLEYFVGIPCSLAAPSIFTVYGKPVDLSGQVAVGISQSGEGTDIVETLEAARKRGAYTVAVTNTPGSAITRTADCAIDLSVGKELALAATKTYTAQLTAMMSIAAGILDSNKLFEEIQRVPDRTEKALALEERVKECAARYRFMTHCVVLGRGFNYATIKEAALKLMETAYVTAQPFSLADFMHGPIALAEPGFPAFLAAPSGRMKGPLRRLTEDLSGKKADILAVSDDPFILKKAAVPIALPERVPEPFSPVPCIVPFQFMAYYMSLAKGIDPDRPRFLNKVTKTR